MSDAQGFADGVDRTVAAKAIVEAEAEKPIEQLDEASLVKKLILELGVEGATIFPTCRLPKSIVLMPGGLVEPRGVEPLTSSVRGKRSPD